MRDQIAAWIARFARRPPSLRRRLAWMSFGAVTFLIVIPGLILCAARLVPSSLRVDCPRAVEMVVGGLSTAVGVGWLGAAILYQWRVGHGTPAPPAPTQTLIVSGPYRLCRNPIQLGAMLYYLGACTLMGGITAGVLAFLAALVFGTLYHRGIEERELALRFGQAYEAYRARTPYLIPWPRRRHPT